jgi:hypothetical protein
MHFAVKFYFANDLIMAGATGHEYPKQQFAKQHPLNLPNERLHMKAL